VNPLLAAHDLRRRYGNRDVVDIAHLFVMPGEVLAVLGPNGAGKSTLFRLLLLLERADAGRVLLDGRDATPGDAGARRRMAGVFQRPYLFDGTVSDNVAYGLRARGADAKDCALRTREALAWLGIEHLARARVRTLSGGEAQRVALARALVLEPDVLLLDEPTASLDIAARRRFREDLSRLVRRHAKCVLLITHDPADAFTLADRIAVMEGGRIVQTGTPDDLLLSPATPFVAAFTGAELLLDGEVVAVEEGLLVARLHSGALVHAALREGEASPVGERVHVAYRPEDVTLSTSAESGTTSAINHYDVVVDSIVPDGALVRVRLSGEAQLNALVTRRSASALSLEAGTRVVAHLKATALRAYSAEPR
jgi:ABC-type Fe3+/spermidine/putrescine transport system ATPase subunit